MYVLVLASQKGGSGKTTLSGHLAVEADRAGAGPVVLIDMDPQSSLSQWWNARQAETPEFLKVGLLDLGDALKQLANRGVKLVVIDTPPQVTTSISQIVSFADLVIVPTRPSPHDLRAVGATVDIVERQQKSLIFVVNAATANARITAETAVALSQHGTVAPVTVHHRVDFAASMVDGRTVGEVVSTSPSAQEITTLWTYIQDRLSRLMRDPRLVPEFRPLHLAVSSLSALDEVPAEDGAETSAVTTEEVPVAVVAAERAEEAAAATVPPAPAAPPDGVERRFGFDRRNGPVFGGHERRIGPFGRRATDRPTFGHGGQK